MPSLLSQRTPMVTPTIRLPYFYFLKGKKWGRKQWDVISIFYLDCLFFKNQLLLDVLCPFSSMIFLSQSFYCL